SCQASSTDRPDRQGPRAGAAPWPYTTLFRSEAIRQKEPAPFEPSTKVRKTLAVFHAISFCRRKYGQPAIGPFIVSMTQGADDILSVLLLAQWGEMHNRRGEVPLDVAPLFETVDDLKRCPEIMRTLLRHDIYREHVES